MTLNYKTTKNALPLENSEHLLDTAANEFERTRRAEKFMRITRREVGLRATKRGGEKLSLEERAGMRVTRDDANKDKNTGTLGLRVTRSNSSLLDGFGRELQDGGSAIITNPEMIDFFGRTKKEVFSAKPLSQIELKKAYNHD